MTEVLAGLLVAVIAIALVVAWRRRRPTAILVDADPEAALLSSAAALRRLGARITRYDSEAGTLEAQVPPAAVVRVRAAAADERTTRVQLEGDGAARGVIRRFRGALSA
jgi:glycine/D-amino acid oxidase-like deaminating enzyme